MTCKRQGAQTSAQSVAWRLIAVKNCTIFWSGFSDFDDRRWTVEEAGLALSLAKGVADHHRCFCNGSGGLRPLSAGSALIRGRVIHMANSWTPIFEFDITMDACYLGSVLARKPVFGA